MSGLIKLTKMHGCGNDYLFCNCLQTPLENPVELAIRLSERHTGIGSDGLILICPSQIADFRMQMYNADGSEGMMCGNGIRCLAKYVYDYGLTQKRALSVETRSGIKYLELTVIEDRVTQVTVDMGEPIFEAQKIPTLAERQSGTFPYPLMQENLYDHLFYFLSMGNPHAVTFLTAYPGSIVTELGPAIENHPLFPERINVEFAQILAPDTIRMRVWERGSGETMACGSGACAVAVAAILSQGCARTVAVELRGGKLGISWRGDNHVILTGPAEKIGDVVVEV